MAPTFGEEYGHKPVKIIVFPTPTNYIHSKLRSITHVATKVHVILRSFVVLTWMHNTSELM
jgi:hypothetical protein